MEKQMYIEKLNKIMTKYNLDGTLLQEAYLEGIKEEDLTSCYADNHDSKFWKEIISLVADFLNDFPKAKHPSYKLF
ncbi:hypothetical protein [Paenibacillus sp. QZ-Y1]|uniref:hypothetical protein n=1 Tax=Paenibacillus sp. QZ-Y1 TaxID=3414511 RepID=UPI003F78B95F